MTELELKTHKEDVDAARLEFYQYWDRQYVQGITKKQAALIEQMAWHFFLHGKGLKK